MSLLYLSDDYLVGLSVWLLVLFAALWGLLRLRRAVKTRPGRLWWVHAALSLWMVALLLTGFELYFAFVYDQTDSFNKTKVSQKWFRMHIEPQERPLRFKDGTGIAYRNDVEFRKPDADEHHICFVGDSFTFGHGVKRVEDRFSNRVADALQEECPGRFLVSNLANAGVELFWIELETRKLLEEPVRIDTLVYVICLNDIETFHPRHAVFYEELAKHSSDAFLVQHSYFFNMLYFRLKQFTVPEIRNYYEFVRQYYEGEPWERMSGKLLQLQDLCREHGTELRIAVFPFLHCLDEDAYPFRDAHARITEFCRTAGIPVLDLEPFLSAHSDEVLTVNPFDAHPNERAHAIAAQAMLTELFSDLVDRYCGQLVAREADGTTESAEQR